MRRSPAPPNSPGTFFVAQSWAGCITNMPGFNLRQAQVNSIGELADPFLRAVRKNPAPPAVIGPTWGHQGSLGSGPFTGGSGSRCPVAAVGHIGVLGLSGVRC